MSKSLIGKALFIAGLCGLSTSGYAQDCIVGSEVMVEQEMVTSADFINISNNTVAKLIITQEDLSGVKVKVNDNILQYINLEVEDNTLNIGLKQDQQTSCFIDIDLEVYVSQHDYEVLTNTSSGNITVADNLVLDTLEVKSTGSGDVRLKGKVDSQTILSHGSGNVYNFDLSSETVNASNFGSGNIETTATDSLTASIYGAGNITFKGNPSTLSSNEFGFGQLINQSADDNGDSDEDNDGIDTSGSYHYGDIDKDGDIDKKDVRKFRRAVRQGQQFDLNYDFNMDGVISRRDVRALAKLCTRPKCKVRS